MTEQPDKKYILYGIGNLGKKACDYLGWRNVYCFADSYKSGGMFCQKPVISIEELLKIKDEYSIVISTGSHFYHEISDNLKAHGVSNATGFYDLYSPDDYIANPKIVALKDTHIGETCFAIGTGPSLSPTDLDILKSKKVFTFGCNSIFNIFGQTSWRPDVYVAQHLVFYDKNKISDMEVPIKFGDLPIFEMIDADCDELIRSYDDKILFYNPILRSSNTSDASFQFSDDVALWVNTKFSVIFNVMQIAVYMGFKKIYLLGCDQTFDKDTSSRKSTYSHFYDEEVGVSSEYMQILQNNLINNASPPNEQEKLRDALFSYVDRYSRSRNFRIYNATRGGELEAFERVSFDNIVGSV